MISYAYSGIYTEHHLDMYTCICIYIYIISYGNYENERGEREIGKEENTIYSSL